MLVMVVYLDMGKRRKTFSGLRGRPWVGTRHSSVWLVDHSHRSYTHFPFIAIISKQYITLKH